MNSSHLAYGLNTNSLANVDIIKDAVFFWSKKNAYIVCSERESLKKFELKIAY